MKQSAVAEADAFLASLDQVPGKQSGAAGKPSAKSPANFKQIAGQATAAAPPAGGGKPAAAGLSSPANQLRSPDAVHKAASASGQKASTASSKQVKVCSDVIDTDYSTYLGRSGEGGGVPLD